MQTLNRRKFLGLSAASSVVLISGTLPLEGCNTSWIDTAEKDIPTIVAITDSLLAIASDATGNALLTPIELAVFNKAVLIAQASLATLEAVIKDYSAVPGASVLAKIDAALIDAQQNLSAILSAVQIKDSILLATISGAVALAISVVSAIQLLIPTSTVSMKLKASGTPIPKVKLLTPSQIKSQYNSLVIHSGYVKHTI